MENKTYARESTLYKARDRQRIGQNAKYDTDVPIIFGTVKRTYYRPCSIIWQERLQENKKEKYAVLRFSLTRLLPPDNASFHSCDLWYALGSLGDSLRPFTQADYDLSDEMVDRFSAFAKSQNPNVDGKPQWNVYSSKPDIKVFK